MLKKIISSVFPLVLFVYIIFFSNQFSLNLSNDQSDALFFLVKIYLISSLLCFVVGELFKNYSQVDKMWSLIPIFYVWYFTYSAEFKPRMLLMAILVSFWGIRLTYNFARKGGYNKYFWLGEEDYRWKQLKIELPILKKRLYWGFFNLFFICLYQMGLIFLTTLPILVAWKGENGINTIDFLIGFLMLLFIIIEAISDNQQFIFQTKKKYLIKKDLELKNDFKRGFISTGLWSFSRHPNFASEQMIWVVFYLFSINATGDILNWSIIGCILLVILFRNSANFSESISKKKYPDYLNYQKNVPMFFGLSNSNWKKD